MGMSPGSVPVLVLARIRGWGDHSLGPLLLCESFVNRSLSESVEAAAVGLAELAPVLRAVGLELVPWLLHPILAVVLPVLTVVCSAPHCGRPTA